MTQSLEVSASDAFSFSLAWDGRMFGGREQIWSRGQQARVGMATDLHLLSVAIGNELLRQLLCAELQP